MDKADSKRKKNLYNSIRRDTDSHFYVNLRELLDVELLEILTLMVKTVDKDELLRLQGKAQVLEHMQTELTRKPIGEIQHPTGAFN